MKILNLYACLGGNRLLWDSSHEVTAVELDPHLAELYANRFQNDKVIVADAHEYLLNHFAEFDFIWSSPPCPTHSRTRYAGFWKSKPTFPDMKLYQEILFLQKYFAKLGKNKKFCVENVIPYYTPLIPAQRRGRHLYWCNFTLPHDLAAQKVPADFITSGTFKELSDFHKFDFDLYKGTQNKKKIARNLVDFETGNAILNAAYAPTQTILIQAALL